MHGFSHLVSWNPHFGSSNSPLSGVQFLSGGIFASFLYCLCLEEIFLNPIVAQDYTLACNKIWLSTAHLFIKAIRRFSFYYFACLFLSHAACFIYLNIMLSYFNYYFWKLTQSLNVSISTCFWNLSWFLYGGLILVLNLILKFDQLLSL